MYNLMHCMEESFRKYPERIAVADENVKISYQSLGGITKRIASSLIQEGIRGKPVAIFLDRRTDCVCAMLGIIFSGNHYMVLDIDMPLDRIRRILASLSPAAIITNYDIIVELNEIIEEERILFFEAVSSCEIDPFGLDRVGKSIIDSDPAYILYTSGSTGDPKGTVITHRALISYTSWYILTFDISKDTVFGSQTPLYFSMSVSDLYGALRRGGRYQIIPREYFSFPEKLIDYMNQYQINTIYWVPSALSIVAFWDTFSYIKPLYLKKVLFAGEVMPVKQLNYWRKHLPDVLYANLFGPTETTDICCYYIVDREYTDDETLPIGYPCQNCGILIQGEDGKESDRGELLVRGSFLAAGYYNDPERTAQAFVANPFQDAWQEVVYRTGDLVCRGEKGELRYLGRKDHQIKHKGYRIELGEIEASVYAVEKVKACACLYDSHEQKILLIYEGNLSEEDLAKEMNSNLLSYMQPGRYIKIRQMPYNANGKIDRTMLKKQYV